MRRTRTAVAACLLLAGAAVGCTSNEPVSSTSTADVTVTPSTEPPADEPLSEEAEETSGGDEPYALTDTVSYENDVEVSLSKFTRATSSEYAAPADTPYVKFMIKVVNGSDRTIDATALTANCSYGEDGQTSEAIFDDGLDGAPTTKLLAGRSINVAWGCELPKDEKVLQIEVSPDFESEAAIFTGNVK